MSDSLTAAMQNAIAHMGVLVEHSDDMTKEMLRASLASLRKTLDHVDTLLAMEVV